ncbi:MAG: ald [Cohnella sp.]|nr:ald [Cohnella sp.]
MHIGLIRERKDNENRVALVPSGVRQLRAMGHTVTVECNAGLGSGIPDEEYLAAGAYIEAEMRNVYADCEMILRVKEPTEEEYGLIRQDQILFAYLHLAASPQLTEALQKSGGVAFAYEMVQEADRSLPLLTPMSEVAGRMSIHIAAKFMEKTSAGKGIMLGGVPGVAPAEVTIIGGGVVGTNAAKMALGQGARVTIIDSNPARLRQLDDQFDGRVRTLMSNPDNISECVTQSDAVIGAVLLPGKKAPKLVSREMVAGMKKGAVIVDVAIDQGGCVETADRMTSHSDPVYLVNDVIHYAVPNIPGIVPRTSTYALSNSTLSYISELANKGWRRILQEPNHPIAKAANVIQGELAVSF